MRQIESAALEDQVVDWMLEHAQITERPMTFKEVTGFGRDGEEQDALHEHLHEHPPEAGSGHEHHDEASST